MDWYADLFITHEVPYSNSYFAKDIDQTKSLIHQPALYDSQGLKLAECATSFELNGVTRQIQVNRTYTMARFEILNDETLIIQIRLFAHLSYHRNFFANYDSC